MNPWFKMLIVLFLLGAGAMGGMAWSRNHYRTIIATNDLAFERERMTWTQSVLKQQEAVTNEVLAKDELKTQLGVEHAKNKTAVDDLFRAVAADRVPKLPAVPCAANNPSNASAGSAGSPPGNQSLSVDPQNAFDEFARGMGEEAHYADTIIESCRVMKLYLLDEAAQ